MHLYELADQYAALSDRLLETITEDGEVDTGIASAMAGIEDSIDGKLSACCRLTRNLEAYEEALKAEAKRLNEKAATIGRRVDSIKGYMKQALEAIGDTKRQVDGVFTVAIQKSPPSVDVFRLDDVPSEFDLLRERAVNRSLISDRLKSGQTIPGCRLIHGTHIRIR